MTIIELAKHQLAFDSQQSKKILCSFGNTCTNRITLGKDAIDGLIVRRMYVVITI